MKINVSTLPIYKDIFDDDPDTFLSSIEAIPIQFVTLLCSINIIFIKYDQDRADQEVVNQLWGGILVSTSDGRKIMKKLSKENSYSIINTYTITELYLILFSIGKYKPDEYVLNEDDLLLLLKLALIANQRRMCHSNRLKRLENGQESNKLNAAFFQRITWESNLAQIDSNIVCNYVFEAVHCYFMMDYLYLHGDTKTIIEDFLNRRKMDSVLTYSTFLMMIVQMVLKNGGFIVSEPQIEAVLSPMCITSSPQNILDIKCHPVFHHGNVFYILNFNYLIAQIYIGTFKTLNKEMAVVNGKFNLKAELGVVMERHFLKPTIFHCFGSYASKIIFDCDFANKGYPDAMFQIGKSIYIFEFKDNILDDNTMESLDFDLIIKKIEDNFVESNNNKKPKPKAVTQIVNNIIRLINGEFDNNDLSFSYDKSYCIYPIILFSDFKYKTSGIGYYIRKRFVEIVKQKGRRISNCFRSGNIKPVTFIGLDFFFNNITLFSKDKKLLKKLLDEYLEGIREDEHQNSVAPAPFERDLYPSFERFHSDYHYMIPPVEDPLELLKLFGIIFPQKRPL